MATYDFLFKLLLIGDADVGKTTILFRFSDNAFNTTLVSTIGVDFKIKTIEINGKKVKLQICLIACYLRCSIPPRTERYWTYLATLTDSRDTAGQDRFHAITTSYYRGAHGIMLVYDITDVKSFENISKWLRTIEEHASEDVEKILLGNKCDMEKKRMISRERGEKIAKERGIKFFETSAKNNINVETAFIELATDILHKTPTKDQSSGGSGIHLTEQKSSSSSCCKL